MSDFGQSSAIEQTNNLISEGMENARNTREHNRSVLDTYNRTINNINNQKDIVGVSDTTKDKTEEGYSGVQTAIATGQELNKIRKKGLGQYFSDMPGEVAGNVRGAIKAGRDALGYGTSPATDAIKTGTGAPGSAGLRDTMSSTGSSNRLSGYLSDQASLAGRETTSTLMSTGSDVQRASGTISRASTASTDSWSALLNDRASGSAVSDVSSALSSGSNISGAGRAYSIPGALRNNVGNLEQSGEEMGFTSGIFKNVLSKVTNLPDTQVAGLAKGLGAFTGIAGGAFTAVQDLAEGSFGEDDKGKANTGIAKTANESSLIAGGLDAMSLAVPVLAPVAGVADLVSGALQIGADVKETADEKADAGKVKQQDTETAQNVVSAGSSGQIAGSSTAQRTY